MGENSSRAVLIGLSAVATAFGAAAMISAAGVPTARADAFSDILADVQAEQAAATAAFTTAAADFAHNDPNDGLTQLFIGLDDELVGVPNDFQVGTIDALSNVPVIPASDFEFGSTVPIATPANFTAAVAEANTFYTQGVALATTILSLPPTDYPDIALDNALSSFYQWILPDQIQFIGELESLGF